MLLDYNVTGPDTAVLTPLTGWLSRLQCILSDQNIANRILLFWHNLASHTSTADRTRELQKPARGGTIKTRGAPSSVISFPLQNRQWSRTFSSHSRHHNTALRHQTLSVLRLKAV